MMERRTHAFGVDDIDCCPPCPRQFVFFAWVTFGEQKWVTLASAEVLLGAVIRNQQVAGSIRRVAPDPLAPSTAVQMTR